MDQSSRSCLQALITGGGSGIGQAAAYDLAKQGVIVHLLGRSGKVFDTMNSIVDAGGRAYAYQGSVAEMDVCQDVIKQIALKFGKIDILINAAAILGPVQPFYELSMRAFADVYSVNLLGTANCMRAVMPGMLAREFGRIINFAGGGAAYAYPQFSAYGVSKCAVVRLTETVAAEVKNTGVTVNVIAPGAVETEMLAEVRRHGGAIHTLVNMIEPVTLLRFLASFESGHINGRFIHVRDNYQSSDLLSNAELWKLRRVESR